MITQDSTIFDNLNKWKLVPLEPTDAMNLAADDAHRDGADYEGIYRAMLAAAPEPPCAAPVAGNYGIEKACQRYTEMILDMYPDLTASRDDTSRWWRPSWSHVQWMLEQIPTLPPTKAHRWLGFIQGALVYCGITSVDAEREATRGMFDEGAAKQGQTCDSPDSSLFDRVQEVITAVYDRDMQIEDAVREVIDLCDGTASAKQEAPCAP